MTRATVNGNATGSWARREGTELEIVGPGANEHHVLVRRPGESKVFGFPAGWLDIEEPEPRICPTCGQVMP